MKNLKIRNLSDGKSDIVFRTLTEILPPDAIKDHFSIRKCRFIDESGTHHTIFAAAYCPRKENEILSFNLILFSKKQNIWGVIKEHIDDPLFEEAAFTILLLTEGTEAAMKVLDGEYLSYIISEKTNNN